MSRRVLTFLPLVLAFAASRSAAGQAAANSIQSPPLRQAAVDTVQSPPPIQSPLTIHGYLTQGYAKTDGKQFLGITKAGTTDYRAAAIQFSYAVTQSDRIVLQFDHKRLGVSPSITDEADLKVDWAFYAHRFDNGTTVKLGKVLIPVGIYNEIRDVGVVLPFYRAPYAFFGEGGWTAETVDGASVARLFDVGSSWSLDATVFAGEWNYTEIFQTPVSYDVNKAHARRGFGSQFWLNTPIEGVRVGAGSIQFQTVGSALQPPGGIATLSGWNTGVEAVRERFKVQSEFRKASFGVGSVTMGYTMLSVSPVKKIDVNVQGDFARVSIWGEGMPPADGMDLNDDIAAGINYHITPSLVAKFEHHWARSYNFEEPIGYWMSPAPRARYFILSFSTAF